MTQLLENKIAIIYGAGGTIGGAVARTFAREGARVVLAGRTRATLDAVAADIAAAGGTAEVAVVDALDERAVEEQLESVGTVDISFNLIQRGDVQGQPLLEMSTDDLMAPVEGGLRTAAITARAAARRMTARGSGVILHLTSGSSAGRAPMMGGTGPADAAIETFLSYLAAEVGPSGVRVVGLWTAGVPESFPEQAEDGGIDAATIEAMIGGMAALRRAPRVAQVAETATFLASDRAGAITGTTVNVTCGLVLQ
jgi:NAD(P)-dependent dehydrogenase (short-subunit alcohol dehydrogenase family)